MTPAIHRDEGGQSIVLYGITFLLLALITLFTVSVGVRVREKIKVQAAADAAAYSLAVDQARTMNTMAWANRAIVSEYVSALSVVSHESYLNWWEGVFLAQSKAYNGPIAEYGLQCIGCPFGCACCCLACQSAKKANDIKNMWKEKWNDLHQIWHVGGEPIHKKLHDAVVGYVTSAGSIRESGSAALSKYKASAKNQTQSGRLGKAIDGRIESAQSPGSSANWTGAVEDDPVREDWDSYAEILTGTRTDWILRQETFVYGVPWLQGLQKQLQMAAQCGGTAISFTSAEGGAMMSQYTDGNQIVQVNQGNQHSYHAGSDKGEGGRLAITSIDYGTTRTTMICRACEPVTYGQASLSPIQDYRNEDPKGCYNTSIVTAYDGYSDGDSSAGANQTWTDANGIKMPDGSACKDQGVTAGGWFRFMPVAGDGKSGTQAMQADLWNQPYAFASFTLDTTKSKTGADVHRPWDFDFGKIGGSVLRVDASKDPSGAANKGGSESLSGKGFDDRVWPKVGGFGTALSYYHNPNHWAEIPNLWNPFWRAKLEDPTDSTGEGGEKKDPARYITKDLTGDDKTVAKKMGWE